MTDTSAIHAQLDAWVDQHFDEQVRFLQQLVRVPRPPAGQQRAAC